MVSNSHLPLNTKDIALVVRVHCPCSCPKSIGRMLQRHTENMTFFLSARNMYLYCRDTLARTHKLNVINADFIFAIHWLASEQQQQHVAVTAFCMIERISHSIFVTRNHCKTLTKTIHIACNYFFTHITQQTISRACATSIEICVMWSVYEMYGRNDRVGKIKSKQILRSYVCDAR